MTIPRLTVIAIALIVFADMKFGGGRGVDALWYQVTRLGYWLSNEFDSLSHMIAQFR
jgi:hypothetical protein